MAKWDFLFSYSLWYIAVTASSLTPPYIHSHCQTFKFLQSRARVLSLENELLVARGEEEGEGIVREFWMDIYTLLYLKWITNKVLLYNIGNSVQCYVAAWMGGVWWRMDTCICMAESLCYPPETITTLLIGYNPIQNKKLKKKKSQSRLSYSSPQGKWDKCGWEQRVEMWEGLRRWSDSRTGGTIFGFDFGRWRWYSI